MSCSVMWKPVSNEGNYVGGGSFRDILEKKYGFPAVLTYAHIEWLAGVRDSGYEEAQILIDAIYEKNKIEIFLEC